MATTIDDELEKKKEQSPEARVLALRENIKTLRLENKKLLTEVGQNEELVRQVAGAVVAADPFPKTPPIMPEQPGSPVSAVMLWSDWHIGEVIAKDEVEDMNEYNYEIGEKRLLNIVDSFLRWAGFQRNIYNIEKCYIIGIGDYISGDIHREFSVTNEFPVPVQAAKAGMLFGEAVRRLAPNFAEVEVVEVGADNHGRLTQKPQFKQKAINSMSFLVHTIANSYLKSHDNVKITTAKGIKHLVEISNHKFLIEHGDNIRGLLGIPWYGLTRTRHREAQKRMNTQLGFHYHLMGHWHVPCVIEDMTIVNGSLCGTTEFDHGQGRYAKPAQLAFLVHPKYGFFNWTPFRM